MTSSCNNDSAVTSRPGPLADRNFLLFMSATLGALLRRLEPDWSITFVERLDAVGAESSGAWNNAGTGHAGLCELNYTPESPDGSIDITKAVRINEQFQVTRQFWAYAVENGILSDVRSFLNPVPHVSFVHGAQRVDYLRRRQQKRRHPWSFAWPCRRD